MHPKCYVYEFGGKLSKHITYNCINLSRPKVKKYPLLLQKKWKSDVFKCLLFSLEAAPLPYTEPTYGLEKHKACNFILVSNWCPQIIILLARVDSEQWSGLM